MKSDINTVTKLELQFPRFHQALFLDDFKTEWVGHVKGFLNFLQLHKSTNVNSPVKNGGARIRQWKTLFAVCIMEVAEEF